MNKYEINIYEQIARNIKKYRKIAGITQAVLAEKVGVSHEFIRRIESKKGAKTFSVDTIWKISLVLNVEPGKLFDVDIDETINSWVKFDSLCWADFYKKNYLYIG